VVAALTAVATGAVRTADEEQGDEQEDDKERDDPEHALTATSSLPSGAAVRRLVTVTLAGLRPR
jgi:hypothetical protein